jgi:hypothetical protein
MNITRKLWLSIGTMATGVVLAAVLLSGAFRSIHRTLSATATGSLVSVNVTQPGGAIWLGNHLWVSDQLQGFCRIDAPATAQPGATVYDPGSPDYCYAGNAIPGLVAGTGGEGTGGGFGLVLGQAAFDPGATYNYIYLPDRSAQSLGVWRVEYDSATETIRPGSGLVLASGTVLAGLRTSAVAVGPDGNLYVGSLTTGTIMRVPNPSGPIELQIPEAIGLSLSKRVYGMTFFGGDLYLATKDGVERIRNAAACTGTCTTEAVPGFPAVETTAIATDGLNWLYAAQPPSAVYEDNMGTGVVAELVNTGLLPLGMTFPISVDPTMGCIDLTCPFSFPVGQNSGLTVAPDGNLYVADDPGATVTTGFAFSFRGRGWEVNPNQPTPTPVPPTPLPTDTPIPTATTVPAVPAVVVAPTDTPLPTDTPVPAPPTDTPVPPTATPVPPTDTPTPVPTAAPPVVGGFAPKSGLPGTVVTITGIGFTGATGVSFGTSAAAVVTVLDDTTLTATVPDGATSGSVTVTNAGGTGGSAASFQALQTCNTTISIPALPGGRTYWVQFTAHSTSTIRVTWHIPVLQSVQLLLYTGNPFFGLADPIAQGPTGKPLVVQNTNKTLDLNIAMSPLSAGTYTAQFFNASNSFGATTGTISYLNTAESPCAASPTTKNVIL